VGKKQHNLHTGDFMLTCKQPYVKAFFETDKPVKSICIDIKPETVDEAFTVMLAKDDYDFDNYLNSYFKHPFFFETVCPVRSAPDFQFKLNQLVQNIQSGDINEHLNREWFLDLVEKVIYHEYGNYLALNGIHSVKPSTKKEILERLKSGKQYIDDNFISINDIAEVAAVSSLSEFHFFRSFKQAFSVTPYQYLLNKRLEFAKSLLQNKEQSLNKIAAQCSFIDLATFSKAFKRQYGVAPTQYSSTDQKNHIVQS
jgi:AraC-like DNA-binding protein